MFIRHSHFVSINIVNKSAICVTKSREFQNKTRDFAARSREIVRYRDKLLDIGGAVLIYPICFFS